MKRHIRDNYYVIGEGIYTREQGRVCQRPSTTASLRKFRFSRMGPKGQALDDALREAVANAMTPTEAAQPTSANPPVPAGFTYLGQFIDHDLTLDRTSVSLGENVTVDELLQGRSPALDLDSLYGRGPNHPEDSRFYSDGIRLRTGATAATPFPDAGTNLDLEGFDLPRSGFGSLKSERRQAVIPDTRNDENLVVAQTHLAFIRFHNRMVEKLANRGTPTALLFEGARRRVVKHYQWMIRTDFLPRIVDQAIVNDVFTNGRRFFEVIPPRARSTPSTPTCGCSRATCRRCRSSSRWRRIGSATAWCAPDITGTGCSGSAGRATLPHWSCCFDFPAPAASFPRRPPMRRSGDRRLRATAHQLDRGFPPALRLPRSRA